MPSSGSKAPFEKFKIYCPYFSRWGTFKVIVWPMAPVISDWIQENVARNKAAQKFIEDAINEKLERERKP